jgi:3-polyprenyl-4-hydroxybenzoate decarboxylase
MILDATGSRAQYSGGSPAAHDAEPAHAHAAPLSHDPRELAPHVKAWRVWEDTMLVVQVDRVERDIGRRVLEPLVKARATSHLKMIAVVSPDVNLDDDVDTLWGIFTRFDPARDLMFTESSMQGVQPLYAGVMGIDATWKPGYPDAVAMDPDVVRRVDARWKEYWE